MSSLPQYVLIHSSFKMLINRWLHLAKWSSSICEHSIFTNKLHDKNTTTVPFSVGDRVWLYTSVVSKGKTKSLLHSRKVPTPLWIKLERSTTRYNSLVALRLLLYTEIDKNFAILHHQILTLDSASHHFTVNFCPHTTQLQE